MSENNYFLHFCQLKSCLQWEAGLVSQQLEMEVTSFSAFKVGKLYLPPYKMTPVCYIFLYFFLGMNMMVYKVQRNSEDINKLM